MKQIVGHKKLTTLQGLALVLALVAILLVLNYVVLNYVAFALGNTAASVTFWVLGGLIALWMIRTYIMVYTYEVNGNVLRLCRKYGKRERFIEDIYLNRIIYVGTFEEARRKDPNAKVTKAVHASAKTPMTAVLYNTSAGTGIMILQAEDALKERLVAAVKSGKSK